MDAGDLLFPGPATRVERTGIALVHEGEFVVAAPDGEATSTGNVGRRGGGPTEIHYWFPVQIEVIGLDDSTTNAVVERVFEVLGQELASQG